MFLLFQETLGKSLEEMDDIFNNESIWAFKVQHKQSRFEADVETAKKELIGAGEGSVEANRIGDLPKSVPV